MHDHATLCVRQVHVCTMSQHYELLPATELVKPVLSSVVRVSMLED